jgi:hypothetical protein
VARHVFVRYFRSSIVKVVKVARRMIERTDSDDICTSLPCVPMYIYYYDTCTYSRPLSSGRTYEDVVLKDSHGFAPLRG